jgi:hypothetical protein
MFMHRAAVTLGLVAAVLVVVGCTRHNPYACCTSQADCDEHGIPLGSDCATGLTCRNNLCVESACQADSDCAAPTARCSAEQVCVECDAPSHCTSGACDLATHSCVECLESTHCISGVCDTMNQRVRRQHALLERRMRHDESDVRPVRG